MAKIFKQRTTYSLPTGAVLIHANQNTPTWHVVVQRDNLGEDYARVINEAINDPDTQQTYPDITLRPMIMDHVDNDTAQFNEATQQFEGETKNKLTEATILLFYELEGEFTDVIQSALGVYNNTPMTIFVFNYGTTQKTTDQNQEGFLMPEVKIARYSNEQVEQILPPKVRLLDEPDSPVFQFLTYDALLKMGAWQKRNAQPVPDQSAQGDLTPSQRSSSQS